MHQGTETVVLNFQYVPISQVVLKTDFLQIMAVSHEEINTEYWENKKAQQAEAYMAAEREKSKEVFCPFCKIICIHIKR